MISFGLPKPASFKLILEFFLNVETFFKVPGIEEVIPRISYDEIPNDINLKEYYEHILDGLIEKHARYIVLKDFESTYNDRTLFIHVDKDNIHLSRYEKVIKDEFLRFGLDIEVKIVVDENAVATQDLIKEVNIKSAEDINNLKIERESASKKETIVKKETYRKKTTIDSRSVSISNIPVDQFAIDEYKATKGPTTFVIEGEIFSIEVRPLKNSTLAEIKITDLTDSILVKRFLRLEDEINAVKELKVNDYIKVSGEAKYDTYVRDVVLFADVIQKMDKPKKNERMDNSSMKRVELHVHTIMSNMDGVTTASDYIDTAIKWGHKAIAFTDHQGVYAIPDINKAVSGKDIKPIYGVELESVDEKDFQVAFTNHDILLSDATYVVFDIETTGLSLDFDRIVELAAVKIKDGRIIDEMETFVDPEREMGDVSTRITGITDEMLKNAPSTKDVLSSFVEFSKGAILVAHNAKFDIGHIYNNFKKLGMEIIDYPVLDTMQIAQAFYHDSLKKFNLKSVIKLFKVKNEQAHRAIHDTRATALAFIEMLHDLRKKGIKNYNEINSFVEPDVLWKYPFPKHLTILVKNQVGYKNMFKIVSDSLTNHFYKEGRALKRVIEENREGILIGSSCVNGEIFEEAMNGSYENLVKKMAFYDYIEVQPICAYKHLKESLSVPFESAIKEIIKKILKAAKEAGKMVVATGDVHYLNPEDKKYRDIYIRTKVVGGGLHPLAEYDEAPDMHFMTTEEMFMEFDFLDQVVQKEIIVENTNKIANMIEPVVAFKRGCLYSPLDDAFKDRGVPSIEADLKRMVNEKVHSMYGEVLPKYVSDRLDKELTSIIKNKFSPIYYMAHLLVKKSNNDGYLVGSRGSVGSSFVATMMDITEVNPLSPHYRCPKCLFSTFKMNEEEQEKYGIREIDKPFQDDLNNVESGFDLPDRVCPICGEKLLKDGHDIPFETFLGFKGDKTPDIDLNFSGDYQGKAHLYVRELMGNEYAFRAGTIATVAEKTAFGYVKGYFEDKGIIARKAEIERLAKKIEGVKRSTGQHPGGIVVVPKYVDIYDVTPIQYPADDTEAEWRTTHFDYHSFEDNLLKLDILGHDDPTLIKYLMDYVHEHQDQFPFDDPKNIPIDDKNLYKLFCGTDIINVKKEDIDSDVASYAVPELGTTFVRQMLSDTKPKTFAELVKISGLSHGTDVWLGNAQALVLGQTDYGKIDFKDVIGCRDDIMVYLMYQGLEPARAFEIMEFVRKGKPTKDPDKWESHKAYMREKKVPEWYIWSCEKIKYMFPKAHATAYVMMAMRIAWFKVHCPILFYSAYFSKRAVDFDPEVMCAGKNAIRNKINDLTKIINGDTKASISLETKIESAKKAEDLLIVLLVAQEMTQRGYSFKMVDINKSAAKDFIIEGDSLIMPFISIPGLGENCAFGIVEEREKEAFKSKNDVLKRGHINKTVFEKMNSLQVFDSLPDLEEAKEETLDLFAFMNE